MPADAPARGPAPANQTEVRYRIILTGYKPNYFISGFSREAGVKFQLSIKLDLWPNPTQHSAYFGYTQKSLWALYGNGGFRDSNYAPEIFYGYFKQLGDGTLRPKPFEPSIDAVRLGYEHESNGLGPDEVRSWDRLYGFLAGTTYLHRDHYLRASAQAWLPILVSGNNSDITDFVGFGKLGASYGFEPATQHWWGSLQIGATYFHGWTFEARQGLEMFLEWRPGYGDHVSWWRFTPNLFAQLYSGYGEHLAAYDEAHTTLRVGISIEDRVYWVNGAR